MDAPFDPCKPTIVITHGWNPAPGVIRLTTQREYGLAIARRFGGRVNVLGWDWNAASFDFLNPVLNSRRAMRQGKCLAAELKWIGVRPESTWLIGHSLGALLMSSAAEELSNGGRCVARLTLLDAVRVHHRFIFGRYRVQDRVRVVENYWAILPSGVGGRARVRGVFNCFVRGRTPLRGTLNMVRSNHVHVVEWYYQTICDCRCDAGFDRLSWTRCN